MAEFLALPLADGHKLKFVTPADFTEWAKATRDEWQWFTQQRVDLACNTQVRAWLDDFWTRCDAAAREASTDQQLWKKCANTILTTSSDIFPSGVPLSPDDPVMVHFAEQYTEPTFRVIAVSASIYAERLPGIRRIGQNDLLHPVCQAAIAVSAAIRAGLTRADRSAMLKNVDLARQNLEDLAAAGRAEILDREHEISGRLEEHNASVDRAVLHVAEQIQELQAKTQAALENLEQTHQNYAEIMRLKAPVDFWEGKATRHRQEVRTYRFWLTGLSVGMLPLLGGVYAAGWWALDEYAKTDAAGSIAMTLYVAGFIGAVTAVVLWFIRIVVRLYMSQHHRAIDAEERASLIRTYLSLTEQGKVTEAERGLALAAVFRASPDGIVKDDGAPSFSPATLLASALDRR
ncbi:MAG: DUF6161 domain-containing protein [Phenylobacterium sp.]|uniref:DUF6161 domain-containing protein n=1 Tax=Phenylobacterium sp. TaxID=1871053 RepID=UPI0027310859|nr:DUF6161 domain-containing protein [Phenylobacterium sp.]MDP2010631.1 DUF6161 domain-containing protein [Phenylobacterium sp.]